VLRCVDSGQLHGEIEVPGDGSWDLVRLNLDSSATSLYIYETSCIRETPRLDSPIVAFCAAIFFSVLSSSVVEWIKGEWCLRAYTGDLNTCMGADESGSVRPLTLFFTDDFISSFSQDPL
jgi:hypothetical protein